MIKMGNKQDNLQIIAAVVSSVILSNESGDSIKPSIGREKGVGWSVSHRRMAMGKTPLKEFQSGRSSRK